MKIPAHLIGLYNRTLRRYRKLSTRLKREQDTGTFHYLTLVRKLRKLRRKIADLQVRLKVAVAAGVLVVGISLSSNAQTTNNGPFVRQPRSQNPLREPFKFYDVTYPAIADIDGDGDLDLLVADQSGYGYQGAPDPMRYLLNVGTKGNPAYEEQHGIANPFEAIDVNNYHRGVVFADIDKDGDQDLFIALSYDESRKILYYRNDNGTFVEQTTAWNPATKAGNPLRDVDANGHIKLAFGDINGDGHLDAIVTGYYTNPISGALEYISFYKGDATGTLTKTTEFTLGSLPGDPWMLNPALADIDEDGDLDLVFGGYYSGLAYYKQVTPGNFVRQTGAYNPGPKTGNPFNDIYFPNTQPIFADFDGDGDADLLLGTGDGDHYFSEARNIIHWYENKGNGLYEEKKGLSNPLDGVDVTQDGSPFLVDLDGDSDLDVLLGNKYGENISQLNILIHYESKDGEFVRREREDSPFGGIEIEGSITPYLVDIDDDGDLDFITTSFYGSVRLFTNNDGIYTEVLTGSPFANVYLGYFPSVEFADMDGDGDFDMIGSSYSGILYFENTGSAKTPMFEPRTGAANPFEFVLRGYQFEGFIALVDIDHDGDIDLMASEDDNENSQQSIIFFYENTGTPFAPKFTFNADQPFLSMLDPAINTYQHQPSFGDVDGDGDLDLFIGNSQGYFMYLKNENPAVVTELSTSDISYAVGIDDLLIVDATLTLSDEDNDLVVKATVTIGNFENGDELHFTDHADITGVYDETHGVLTLTGKAPLNAYQTVLRTVAFRRRDTTADDTRQKAVIAKTIEFRVYDTDLTNPEVATRNVNMADASELVQVFNAVAPASTGDNKFMRIVNLPTNNTVAIYNRWGDKVFETSNYDSQIPEKRFEGMNNNGKELATGTYFYRIEINEEGYSGPRLVTGYVFLKR